MTNNPINYWYQKYQALKKVWDALLGDKDFKVFYVYTEHSKSSFKRAEIPSIELFSDNFKPEERVRIIIVKENGS